VRLGVVVQRYGANINGGAERHARYIAEHLARHHQIEVLTTCARDYVTWRDEFAPGVETVHGIPVRRFPVRRERDPTEFGRLSERVFERPHSMVDELAWLRSEGPESPALIRHLRRNQKAYDFLFFFSYRYYHAYHGVRAASRRAVLVPTAERDSAIGVSLFGPVFRGARAIMYNSPEERAMINAVSGNSSVPSVVVGVGSDVPAHPHPERFRHRYDLEGPFVLYVGRIDENKGCRELFDYFKRYAAAFPSGLQLVLLGGAVMPVPEHPRIRHLGFVTDEDKFDALAAADLLVMPSFFESLSMVVIEAWALGRPVLVNGRCDVLKGQCLRSGAGLYYETYEEFAETLYALEASGPLNGPFGRNGRAYFERHYSWSVIERKYLDMLDRLRQGDAEGGQGPAIEPLPGWLARRRRLLPAAREAVEALPAGPAPEETTPANGPPVAGRTTSPSTAGRPTSRSGPTRRRPDQRRGRRLRKRP
jgi:glycosyltransferase involved in cell wall biosynthesis